jgi:tetratricopeptide (TPR) repeat protein
MNRLACSLCLGVAVLLAGGPASAQKAKGKAKARPAPAGQRYALLVGVKQYDKAELRGLDYTENDVTALAELFKNAGYKRVVLLTQTRGAFEARYLPTAANIRRELKGLLEARRPDDTVVLAFAGHGVQFAGSDEPYFCPMDAKLANKKTLISLSEVYGTLNGCKARVKLLLSDCCRNDPLPDGTRSALGKNITTARSRGKQKPPENVVALFSCSAGETAYESKKLKHGVFFYHLIQGLRGKAALRGDKVVTLGVLKDYVSREVDDFVKDEVSADAHQRPELFGRFSGTITLIELDRKVTQIDPSQMRALLDKGWNHLRSRQFKDAITVYNEVLRINPNSAIALAMRAQAYEFTGEKARALVDADKALALDDSLSTPYLTRGNLTRLEKQYTRAIASYTEAIRHNPQSINGYNGRGLCHAAQNDHFQAMRDFSEAIRLDPKFPAAYFNRGRSHTARRDFKAALADFDQAIQLNPTYGAAYAHRGDVYRLQNDLDRALADFDLGTKHAPRYPPVWYFRGLVHAQRKENDKAISDYTTAIRLNKNYAAALFSRAFTFYHKGDPDAAIGDLNAVVKLEPKNAMAFSNRGVAWARKGKFDKAISDYNHAIKLNPKDPLFYSNRAIAYEKTGQKAKARADKDKAAQLQAARNKGGAKKNG